MAVRVDPCRSCGSIDSPMCFTNDPYCSDLCRKDLDVTHDDQIRGPHTSPPWIRFAAPGETPTCTYCTTMKRHPRLEGAR